MDNQIDEFEKWVGIAIDGLPDQFREKLNNVAIVVEDWPTQEQLIKLKIYRGTLLGLYEGIPQTKRSGYGIGATLPDKITIFKYPIMQIAQTKEEIIKQVQETVRHEIAHHFGMNEEQVRKAMSKVK